MARTKSNKDEYSFPMYKNDEMRSLFKSINSTIELWSGNTGK
jgi:hypothetical protein